MDYEENMENAHYATNDDTPLWTKDWIILKTDRTGFFFPKKRQNNCEKLNTRFHLKFPAAILKNPYYTPSHVIRHTLLHQPPYNTAHFITPRTPMVVYFRRLLLSKWITKKTWKMLIMQRMMTLLYEPKIESSCVLYKKCNFRRIM
jgi:hypothetical protein